jgi:hypothetical protein
MGIMSLSEIMDKSIEILRKHVKSFALFTVGYGIIAFLLAFAVIIIGILLTVFAATLLSNVWLAGTAIGIIALLAASLGASLYAGTIKIASQEYSGEQVFAQDAIKASFKSIFKVFGVIFIGMLMFIPIAAILFLIGRIFYEAFDRGMINIDMYHGRELLFVLPPILFVLAVVFIISAYTTWFSFTLNVIVVEKKGVFSSIKRSFSLIRNNYWRIFGCTILFSLTAFALRSSLDTILAVVAGVIYLLVKLLNINGDFITFFTTIYSYASWPINLVTWMVISPVSIIMMTLLYFNQRFKREGLDIALKLKVLQNNEERKQSSELTEFNDSH